MRDYEITELPASGGGRLERIDSLALAGPACNLVTASLTQYVMPVLWLLQAANLFKGYCSLQEPPKRQRYHSCHKQSAIEQASNVCFEKVKLARPLQWTE